MNDTAVPDKIRHNPLLHFGEDGSVRIRWGWPLWIQLVTSVCCLVLSLYMSRVNDVWFGPPLIVGGFASLLVWHVVELRRLLRVARSPENRLRMPLSDLFVYTLVVAIFFAGWAINDRQRTAELARRAEVQQATAAILGSHGKLERDHRARLWLTIGDPSFDDSRLVELLDLLEYDQCRYGITRLMFSIPTGTRFTSAEDTLTFWPQLTDQSIERLTNLESLRELWLHGTAISPQGSERLIGLPDLRSLSTSEPLDDGLAAAAFEANPHFSLRDGPDWPQRRMPVTVPSQALPPLRGRQGLPTSLPAQGPTSPTGWYGP